jgi:hypothetical protein
MMDAAEEFRELERDGEVGEKTYGSDDEMGGMDVAKGGTRWKGKGRAYS